MFQYSYGVSLDFTARDKSGPGNITHKFCCLLKYFLPEFCSSDLRISQLVRMRNVAHILAQIERVGEDAHLWGAMMNIHQNAPLLTKTVRSFLSLFILHSLQNWLYCFIG